MIPKSRADQNALLLFVTSNDFVSGLIVYFLDKI